MRFAVSCFHILSLLADDSSYGRWTDHRFTCVETGLVESPVFRLDVSPVIVPQPNFISRLWRGSTAGSPYCRGRYGLITHHRIRHRVFVITRMIMFSDKIAVI